ncbi:MAG TPA: C-GCAxxG-C-C family protein [Bacteroidales bacterium]|nr:C-GCAxxG-C-C family protein [Bacteroidales bacterium]
MTTNEKCLYARQQFAGELNCAQSVLSAYAEELELSRDELERMGAALGGGMGEGEICGAVSAALLVLGLKLGHTQHTPEKKPELKAAAEDFRNQFLERFNSLKCSELIGLQIKNAPDRLQAHANNVFDNECAGFICAAIALVDKITDKHL